MASERFEEILDGHKADFELQWPRIQLTFQDVQKILDDNRVGTFVRFTTCRLKISR